MAQSSERVLAAWCYHQYREGKPFAPFSEHKRLGEGQLPLCAVLSIHEIRVG